MKLIFITLVLLSHLSLNAQSFVNSSNRWFIDDCCFDPYEPSNEDCITHCYQFGDSIMIDGLEYRPLLTTSTGSIFPFGKYYRESEGKVYMKYHWNGEEYLIYDFNVYEGEKIELSVNSFDRTYIVMAIDSLELLSGEKRKRLEIREDFPNGRTTFWIEGIGSELAPMNPAYSFTFDCWIDLNCFSQDSVEQLHLKQCYVSNCDLSTSTSAALTLPAIQLYPNPVKDHLIIDYQGNGGIQGIGLFDLYGNSFPIDNRNLWGRQEINTSHLARGIYFINIRFRNGETQLSKFIKI